MSLVQTPAPTMAPGAADPDLHDEDMPAGLEMHQLRTLRRGGLAVERIARRTVAFFLITSAGTDAAVIVVGAALAVGVIAYRAVLLWIPAALGGVAFTSLKRSLRDEAAARIPCADDPLAPKPAVGAP